MVTGTNPSGDAEATGDRGAEARGGPDKGALTRGRLAEPFLVSLYRVLAPYRGCGHGCSYCDGRAERYYVEGDFERDVEVRENLVERIAADVAAGRAAREFGAFCMGSGVTDVYQPIERRLGLSRRALEALAGSGLPAVILTKGDLVRRDFDLLARLPVALVIVTVTTVDEAEAAWLEPGAPAPSARLAVVAEAKARGLSAGVMAMPLCPGLSDGDESFGALLDAAARAGADFVYPGGLTLRPGRQKELFLSRLESARPGLLSEYRRLYAEDRPSGMPLAAASSALAGRLDRLGRQAGMPQMIPHGVYRRLLSPPDAVHVLLSHLAGLYDLRGVDTRPLRAAASRYADWLARERTALRRARLPYGPSDPFPVTRLLSERLAALASAPAGLAGLLGNERLAALLAPILLEDAVFDYPRLRLA